MERRFSLFFIFLAVSFLSTVPQPAEAELLVEVQKGELPIVISAPHGGQKPIEGGREKAKGTKVRDVNVDLLAKKTAELIDERLDSKVHYVVAHFQRKFVDANRGTGFKEEGAYGDPVSKKQYDAYHGAVRQAVDAVREEHGAGLLIDLHGQSRFPEKIIRGTVNGETVSDLIDRHGIQALIGADSLFGNLAQQGLPVEPPISDASENPNDEIHFIGGYIVRAYGSQNPDGIDSIQIEVGRNYRSVEMLDEMAEKLSDAIVAHAEAYLLRSPAQSN